MSSAPISLQIATALASALAQISVAAGYFNDVRGASIDFVNFGKADQFPQIVVAEESANITDSNAQAAYIDSVYVCTGFVPSSVVGAISAAHRLRDDMLTACGRIARNKKVFEVDGTQLVREFQLIGPMEIHIAPDAQDFVQAVVRVSISHTRLFTT